MEEGGGGDFPIRLDSDSHFQAESAPLFLRGRGPGEIVYAPLSFHLLTYTTFAAQCLSVCGSDDATAARRLLCITWGPKKVTKEGGKKKGQARGGRRRL